MDLPAPPRDFRHLPGVDKLRLRDPETGAFLHMAGTGTTQVLAWAWLGTARQAETLRERALARGEDWPFTPIRRDLVEIVATQDAN
ncbi:MAG: hypothetical protein KDJ82_16285 [Rhodobacteraceae bacterium]|nr:hypothetical protein [Paracoccaceae bacterium]